MSIGLHERMELAKARVANHPARRQVQRLDRQQIDAAREAHDRFAQLRNTVKRAVENYNRDPDRWVGIVAVLGLFFVAGMELGAGRLMGVV